SALAERLARTSAIRVREAVDGAMVESDCVYLAPGGTNTTVVGAAGAARFALAVPLAAGAAVPSADVLFRSAAGVFGAHAIAVVLTGMGRDGTEGVRAIRGAGGRAIVQDRDSSAIYGMPRAALAEAGADAVISLDGMASAIVMAIAEEPRAWQTA
ncbi:MAG TPA: CheB methylesterase domain-containing protein, partial [Candidatus Elarobacter sp.]|nr:CheB methylesterase domain-containing protein [Candidatus Elarobacter sp.]